MENLEAENPETKNPGESLEVKKQTYKVYARPDSNGYVKKIFSDCFEQPAGTDIFVSEGSGDEYVHVQGICQVFDGNHCHNYKIVDGQMVHTTAADKQSEIETRPETGKQTTEQKLQELNNTLELIVNDIIPSLIVE